MVFNGGQGFETSPSSEILWFDERGTKYTSKISVKLMFYTGNLKIWLSWYSHEVTKETNVSVSVSLSPTEI
jgi:hypothetical protein